MKKSVLIVLIVAVCMLVALSFGVTYALIIRENTAESVITMGDLSISTEQITEDSGTPEPASGDIAIIPGRKNSLIFKVKNEGSLDAYIRVEIDKKITLAQGVSGIADPQIINFKINETDWEYRDGYYYYKKPLKSGEKTEPLYTSVSFDKNLPNMYQDSTAVTNTYVSATQVKNNGTDVFNATGWVSEKS